MTEVTATAPLHIDAARTQELISMEPGLLGDEVGVDLRHGPAIRQPVAIDLGAPVTAPGRAAWALGWQPRGHTVTLPAFEGTLEVVDSERGEADLRLTGSYRPPLGVVGIIVDGVIGHRVAEVSIEHFVAAAARRLDRAAVQGSRPWHGPDRPADLRPA